MASEPTTNRTPRILFVDDEPSILRALRLVFLRDRARWELLFVGSGAAALAELERARCDVIISDLDMPDMDGEALLREVDARFPTTAKILLTALVERAAVERLRSTLHDIFAKPCEIVELRRSIERALAAE